jgi:hypothetical protein
MLSMAAEGWMESIVNSLRTQAATWFVGFVIAMLTLFSSQITEYVKFALNSADLRSKYYEELAVDLSEYAFEAELTVEFIANGWTTETALVPLIKEYNDSITKLRKKEYVYLSWTARFWGRQLAEDVTGVYERVKLFDKAIHALNDEFEAVNITKSKPKIDPARAQQELTSLRPALQNLQTVSKAFLIKLR